MLEAAKLSVKSILTNFVSFGFTLVFGIIYLLLLFRYAPVEIVSDYFLVMAIISLSGLALSNIISFSCNYQLPEVYHRNRKEAMMMILVSTLLSGAISGIVVFSVGFSGIFSLGIMDVWTLGIYALLYNVSVNAIGYLGAMFRIREKMALASLQPVFRFLVMGFLVLDDGALSGYDVALFLFSLVSFNLAVLLYLFAREGLDFRYIRQGYGWIAMGLSNGLWFYVDNLGSTLLGSIDSFMLGAVNLKNAIAGYNAALNPSKYIQVSVPGNIGGGLFPVIRSGKFKESTGTIIEYGTKWTILLIYPLTIAAFFFADRVIAILAPAYTGYADVARIIILGFALTPISSTIRQILISMGRARFVALTTIGAGLVNIILNLTFFFVFNMGYVGIAIATAISNILIDIVLLNFSRIVSLKKVVWDILKFITLPTIVFSALTFYLGGMLDVPLDIDVLKNIAEFGIVVSVAYLLCLPAILLNIKEREKRFGMILLNNMRDRFQV